MFSWLIRLLIRITHSRFSTPYFIIVGILAFFLYGMGQSSGDDGDETLKGIFMASGVILGIIFFFSILAAIFGDPSQV